MNGRKRMNGKSSRQSSQVPLFPGREDLYTPAETVEGNRSETGTRDVRVSRAMKLAQVDGIWTSRAEFTWQEEGHSPSGCLLQGGSVSENAGAGESRALTPRTSKVWGLGFLGSAELERFNLLGDMNSSRK